ncbi:extracellular solute-binding protein [Paenibacillus guangzhouensis]|uniref:extracellular solute-binding protein n=1 Tax=Paenibacillus guangzhouensis TaxID=1473112 RepID=UPI0022393047|nr:extracellular solute-binding protein [Paenibacillus guangzhouensis]
MSRRLMMTAVFAVLFSSSFLTACDKAQDTSGKDAQGHEATHTEGLQPEPGAELLVWESKGPELEFLKAISVKFEQQYGVKVKVEAVPAIDSVKKLTTDGPAGIGADVFSAPHDQLGNAVTAGLMLENDVFDEKMTNEFMSSAISGVKYQDVLYGYPTAIDTYALFYNKKLMTKPPQTYDDIMQFAVTYNDPPNKKYAFMWDVAQLYQSYSFLGGTAGISLARKAQIQAISA